MRAFPKVNHRTVALFRRGNVPLCRHIIRLLLSILPLNKDSESSSMHSNMYSTCHVWYTTKPHCAHRPLVILSCIRTVLVQISLQSSFKAGFL